MPRQRRASSCIYLPPSLQAQRQASDTFYRLRSPRSPRYGAIQIHRQVSRGAGNPEVYDGTSSRDYTYIEDIVAGVVRAVRPYPYQISTSA
jgi:nucleoside-diphosphate-sugar epimerase